MFGRKSQSYLIRIELLIFSVNGYIILERFPKCSEGV